VPSLEKTQDLNRVFPFVAALQQNNQSTFFHFWEQLGYLWNEDILELLFRLLAKKDLSEHVPRLFKSRTTHAIFDAMSYMYRFQFVEGFLNAHDELVKEALDQYDDPEDEVLYEIKHNFAHFFSLVHSELAH